MAKWVKPEDFGPGYKGATDIFEFVNEDGQLQATNCGQAAAATLLTWYGKLSGSKLEGNAMSHLERHFPPDNLFGWLGTSRRRVVQACKAGGLRVRPLHGEARLRTCLDAGRPVLVMLGVSAGTFWRWDLPGGHWMVAYGYDAAHVYLTNWWGRMSWDEFRAGWNGLVPRLIGMRNTGLAAVEKG